MCPACIASAAMIAISTTSGGSLGAFVGKKLAAIHHEKPALRDGVRGTSSSQNHSNSHPVPAAQEARRGDLYDGESGSAGRKTTF
jgi:hypothetical protein